MTIQETTRNGATVLHLEGRFDFNARQAFQAAVQKVKASGGHRIVFDFGQVSYVDSAALGLLAIAKKTLEQAGWRLSVANVQDYVKKVFDLANLAALIPIYSTVEEAATGHTTPVSA